MDAIDLSGEGEPSFVGTGTQITRYFHSSPEDRLRLMIHCGKVGDHPNLRGEEREAVMSIWEAYPHDR
jgi:hypothetical protein